jgi:hypothetical protein
MNRRNWCHVLCPLGPCWGWQVVFPSRRLPEKYAATAAHVDKPAPSFDRDILQQEDCIRCMEWFQNANSADLGFRFVGSRQTDGVSPERRVLLGSLVSGLFLARFFRFGHPEHRPACCARRECEMKGVPEKCVRCGECMKVCLKNASTRRRCRRVWKEYLPR